MNKKELYTLIYSSRKVQLLLTPNPLIPNINSSPIPNNLF